MGSTYVCGVAGAIAEDDCRMFEKVLDNEYETRMAGRTVGVQNVMRVKVPNCSAHNAQSMRDLGYTEIPVRIK